MTPKENVLTQLRRLPIHEGGMGVWTEAAQGFTIIRVATKLPNDLRIRENIAGTISTAIDSGLYDFLHAAITSAVDAWRNGRGDLETLVDDEGLITSN